MSYFKKVTSVAGLAVCLILSLLFFQNFTSVQAQESETQTQEELTCYSQCAAYKFFWEGMYCYDLFTSTCTEKVGIKDAITFVKNVHNLLKKNELIMWFDVDKVFKAWFVCKPLIENCIVPELNNCREVCQYDSRYFAPDLSVGHPSGHFHGVIYDEKQNKLFFKVVNNGYAYAWDIEVEASYGHTADRDGYIPASKSSQLFKKKIEHLIYLGARNGPPKSLSDRIGDFLIDEALAGKFFKDFKSMLLSDFKSDSKNYSIPNFWIEELPFTPIPGELNQIILNVDPSNLINEYNEYNNTYILNIDLRPTPPQFSLEDLSYQLVDQTLNEFWVNLDIKNNGEESGQAIIKIYEESEQTPPVFQKEAIITSKDFAGGRYSVNTIISIDPSKETSLYCGKLKKYLLTIVNQENNQKITSEFYLPIYIGDVWGRVVDLHNKAVVGATIKSSSGQESESNYRGVYHLNGINSLGKITLTATHPEFSQTSSREIEIKIDSGVYDKQKRFLFELDKVCEEGKTHFTGIDLVLKDVDVLFKVTVKDKIPISPLKLSFLLLALMVFA